MDFDVIIIGAGPAGLAAAAELAQAPRRVLVIERECFGGQVARLDWIEDYPRAGERIEGPKLAAALVAAAGAARMEINEVIELQSYSGCRSVTCADGKAYTAPVLILAGGLKPRPLGIPGEEKFQGKGMIHCAFCDGGLYTNKSVAVCGGGDAGIREALYLAKFASTVHVIEAQSQLTATSELQALARGNRKLDIRLGQKPLAIVGGDYVAQIEVEELAGGRREKLAVHGVLVHAGFDPVSEYLQGVVALDQQGCVAVSADMQADSTGVYAAGDVRGNSPRRVSSAMRDGKTAAAAVLRFLMQQ